MKFRFHVQKTDVLYESCVRVNKSLDLEAQLLEVAFEGENVDGPEYRYSVICSIMHNKYTVHTSYSYYFRMVEKPFLTTDIWSQWKS